MNFQNSATFGRDERSVIVAFLLGKLAFEGEELRFAPLGEEPLELLPMVQWRDPVENIGRESFVEVGVRTANQSEWKHPQPFLADLVEIEGQVQCIDVVEPLEVFGLQAVFFQPFCQKREFLFFPSLPQHQEYWIGLSLLNSWNHDKKLFSSEFSSSKLLSPPQKYT